MNNQVSLEFYGLNETQKKTLYYLDKGFNLTNIADILDKHKSTISKAKKELEKRGMIEKIGSSKPFNYHVKINIESLDFETTPGVFGGPENPLISIHGSEVVFCGAGGLYAQLSDNREVLGRLQKVAGFDRIERRGNGYNVFRFFYGGFLFRVHKSKVLVSKESGDLVAPVGLDVDAESDHVSYSVRRVEREALDEVERVMESWLNRLNNFSNGYFKTNSVRLRGWSEHDKGPWVQSRHFVFEYGDEVSQKLSQVGDYLKLPLEGLYVDWSRGCEAELESDMEGLVEDLCAVKEAQKEGGSIITHERLSESLDDSLEDSFDSFGDQLVSEIKGEVKEELMDELVGEVKGVLRDELMDGLASKLVERALSEIRDGDGSSKEENDDNMCFRFHTKTEKNRG